MDNLGNELIAFRASHVCSEMFTGRSKLYCIGRPGSLSTSLVGWNAVTNASVGKRHALKDALTFLNAMLWAQLTLGGVG